MLVDKSQPKEPYCYAQCGSCYERCSGWPAVEVPRHTEGAITELYGSTEADLAVTYNYGALFRSALPPSTDGLRGLDGVQAAEAIPMLEAAVETLGTEQDTDYWKPTPGNAGYALSALLRWARLHPSATFLVT